jgi:ferritin
MISKTMSDAINAQINAELYSSYLYLSMSAYFESVNLPGGAHWVDSGGLFHRCHRPPCADPFD